MKNNFKNVKKRFISMSHTGRYEMDATAAAQLGYFGLYLFHS